MKKNKVENMKNFGWDYEESKTKYYHIFPCSEEGEALVSDSLTFDLPRTNENDDLVDALVETLNTLAHKEKSKTMEVGDWISCVFVNYFGRDIEKIVGEDGDSFLVEGKIGGWGSDKNDNIVRKLEKKYLSECYYIVKKN